MARAAPPRVASPVPLPPSTTPPSSPPGLDRRQLIEQYLPYVHSIAGKIKKTLAPQVDFNDLVEYGMIGLLEAADRYDPQFGANFMTFAYYRIRGAIYDGLRGMGWMRRSEYTRARFEERANHYLAELAQQQDDATPPAEPPPPSNPFEHAVRDLSRVVQGLAVVYMTTLDSAEGANLKDENASQPEESLGLEQARHLVRQSLKKLTTQERELLEMYYYRDMNLKDIGIKMQLSTSWVSRLHAKVIAKLHLMLQEPLGS